MSDLEGGRQSLVGAGEGENLLRMLLFLLLLGEANMWTGLVIGLLLV